MSYHLYTSSAMSYVHLFFGIALFLVFTITGRYMRVDFPDKQDIDQAFRLLMRSRHIYILFSALIHLSLGAYLRIRPQPWQRVLQIAGSAVLIGSSIVLVYAFFIETYELRGFSSLSRYGIYSALAGVGLHVIGGVSRSS